MTSAESGSLRRGRIARGIVLVALALAFAASASAIAFAFPDTSWPGRSQYGDGCWYTNCHYCQDWRGTGPHGNYASTANICGICHTIHDAPGTYKLLPEDTLTDTCFFCHDGTAASGKGVYGAIVGRGQSVNAQHRVETTNVIPGGDPLSGGDATATFSENPYPRLRRLPQPPRMGRTIDGITGGVPYKQVHNRAFVMPYPRAGMQAGHEPICMQCHEDVRSVGSPGAVVPGVISSTDGNTASDNPRFQNFPHESTQTAFLIELNDDLCLNCHPAAQLP